MSTSCPILASKVLQTQCPASALVINYVFAESVGDERVLLYGVPTVGDLAILVLLLNESGSSPVSVVSGLV